MARIEEAVHIGRSPDEVWAVVGDLGAISAWLPAIAESSFANGVRECTMEGGGRLREEVISRDDAARRYEYRITDAPLPLEHHQASMAVEPSGAGSQVTWVTDVQPDELAGGMESVITEGMQALKSYFEG